MLMLAFLHWWYGPGWRDAGQRVLTRVRHIYLDFSVPILARTLASPWRRIVSVGQGSLGQRARAMVDNVVSRLVGLAVRLIALGLALILMSMTLILGSLLVVLWPVIPVAGLALIVGGLVW